MTTRIELNPNIFISGENVIDGRPDEKLPPTVVLDDKGRVRIIDIPTGGTAIFSTLPKGTEYRVCDFRDNIRSMDSREGNTDPHTLVDINEEYFDERRRIWQPRTHLHVRPVQKGYDIHGEFRAFNTSVPQKRPRK